MGENQVDGSLCGDGAIRCQRQVHSNCAAQIPQFKTQDGMAFQTTLLHIHGVQITQMRFAIDINLVPHFTALAPLKGFKVALLPGVRGVRRVKNLEPRDAPLDAIIGIITLHHLTQHGGRIQQRELLPLGGSHRIPRHM